MLIRELPQVIQERIREINPAVVSDMQLASAFMWGSRSSSLEGALTWIDVNAGNYQRFFDRHPELVREPNRDGTFDYPRVINNVNGEDLPQTTETRTLIEATNDFVHNHDMFAIAAEELTNLYPAEGVAIEEKKPSTRKKKNLEECEYTIQGNLFILHSYLAPITAKMVVNKEEAKKLIEKLKTFIDE